MRAAGPIRFPLKVLHAALLALCSAAPAPPAAAQAFPPGAMERERVAPAIELRAVELEGPPLLSKAEVDEAVHPFLGRMVRATDLRAIADTLTTRLEAAGYHGSRVRLPDQAVSGGAVRLRVEPARVVALRIAPTFWNRHLALHDWLLPGGEELLYMPRLQERLVLLRESGLVDRVDAELVPFAEDGALHALRVVIEEAMPLRAGFSVANNRSPGIGAVRRELLLGHRSVIGWGDAFEARIGRTRGLDDSSLAYRLPLPRTSFALLATRTRSDSLAVDPPEFRELGITALGDTDGAGVEWSWSRGMAFSATARYQHERRSTRSELLGFEFSFIPGVEGEGRVRVHRVSQDLLWRGESSSTALRASWSHGRTNADPSFDAEAAARNFDSVGVATNHVLELGRGRGQLHARAEAQFSRDRLFPFEKISLGGAATVRGYRENAGLFDRGAFASIEWRSQGWRFLDGHVLLAPGVFIDAGAGRNSGGEAGTQKFASAGLLLRAEVFKHGVLNVAYGRARDRQPGPRRDWQDRGLHYSLTIAYP
jgi:hemolysin activation/secretion protein